MNYIIVICKERLRISQCLKMIISFIFWFFFALQKLVAQNDLRSNILLFGANGGDDKDDTKAIQNCIDAVAGKGGGIVYIPNGTYLVSRPLSAKAIVLQARSNVSLMGESREGTIIKLASHQRAFSWMVLLTEVNSINIQNLTFDGNVNNQIDSTKPISYNNPDEHLAGLFLDNASQVRIINCKIINTGGDGIGIRGVLIPSTSVTIDSCYFDNNYREGIALGSGFKNITIHNCYFGESIKHDPIHTEPEEGLFVGNCIIENNEINNQHRLTVSGSRAGLQATGFIIKHNSFQGTSMYLTNTSNVEISGNDFNQPVGYPAITIFKKNNGVMVENNVISVINDAAITMAYSANEYPKNVTIIDNKINCGSLNTACINIRGGDNIKIINNFISNHNAKTLLEVTATRQMDSLEFSNNVAGYFQTNFSFRLINNFFLSNFKAENNSLENKSFAPQFNVKANVIKGKMIIQNNH